MDLTDSAVHDAVYRAFRAANPIKEFVRDPKDFSVSKELFDAFARIDTRRSKEGYLGAGLQRTGETRPHFYFQGVACFCQDEIEPVRSFNGPYMNEQELAELERACKTGQDRCYEEDNDEGSETRA